MDLESNGVFELPVEIVPHNARATGWKGNSGLVSSPSELEQIGDMTIATANSEYTGVLEVPDSELCRKAQVRCLVVGGKSGSRDVVLSDSKSWTAAGRATSGLRRVREDARRKIAMHSGERRS